MGVSYYHPRAVCKVVEAYGNLGHLVGREGSLSGPTQTAIAEYQGGIVPTLNDTFAYYEPEAARGVFGWGIVRFMLQGPDHIGDPTPDHPALDPIREKVENIRRWFGMYRDWSSFVRALARKTDTSLPINAEDIYERLAALSESDRQWLTHETTYNRWVSWDRVLELLGYVNEARPGTAPRIS
jgi:hypothetical protein